ncbi:MAG TPA: hypothetical protein DHV14_10740, partial [Micrococcales bacterium]
MAKVRVHELARELGIDSKTMLSRLQEMGEYAKSASSTIEPPVVRRVREQLAGSGAPAGAPAGGAPTAGGSTPA